LFKGELSLNDIVDMEYKKLVSLRETRVKRLVDEAKSAEQESKIAERQSLRDRILQK